jgi:hypothetical protein
MTLKIWLPILRQNGIWLLLLGSLLVRLPFILNDYGIEEDSWGHVLHTYELRETGIYTISRLPGHPVYEGLLYLISFLSFSPLAFNGLSLLSGLTCIWFFHRIYHWYRFPNPLLATAAFSVIPVFLIASSYTIDYCVALALVLAAYDQVLRNRWWPAALLLGLATGVRLTSLAMGLPLFLMVWDFSLKRKAILRALGFGLLSFLVAGLCYLPPYFSLGWAFFDTYALPLPPFPKIIYKATLGVFGVTGILGVIIAFGPAVLGKLLGKKHQTQEAPAVHVFGWVVTFVLYSVAYLKVPEKAAFFIPILPFLLLFGAYWLPDYGRKILFISLLPAAIFPGINTSEPHRGIPCAAPSVEKIISGQAICFDPFRGPLAHDYLKRQNKQDYTTLLFETYDQLPTDAVLIAGWWQGMLATRLLQDHNPRPDVACLYFIPPDDFQKYLDAGRPILYLPEQEAINDRKYGNQLASTHGRVWNPEIDQLPSR